MFGQLNASLQSMCQATCYATANMHFRSCNQIEFRLVSNQSEKCIFKQNFVYFSNIDKLISNIAKVNEILVKITLFRLI